MNIQYINKFILLILFFIISAFFSGSEVALFSLDRKKLKILFNKGSLALRYATRILESPRRLLVTVLVGNNLAHVAASIIAVDLAIDFATNYNISENIALTLQIVILTSIIIIFSEIVPKVWAQKNPVVFTKVIIVPFYWSSVILYPISETITEFIKFLTRKIRFNKSHSAITHEDISHLADLGLEKGTLKDNEQEMIQSIVSSKDVTVKEIMRPRVDIEAISVEDNYEDLIERIKSKGLSRFPLYENDLDNIIGVIHAKDLLPILKDEQFKKNFSMTKIAREVLFVPETKLISEMMKEFKEKKMHIAIVVDEYGGTSGLVTLEDIIEEVVGEIRDEYDKDENLFQQINENTFSLSGSLSIEEVNEKLNINIESDDGSYETLAGFIFSKAENIPQIGYNFIYEGFKFTVKDILNKRIRKIIAEKIR